MLRKRGVWVFYVRGLPVARLCSSHRHRAGPLGARDPDAEQDGGDGQHEPPEHRREDGLPRDPCSLRAWRMAITPASKIHRVTTTRTRPPTTGSSPSTANRPGTCANPSVRSNSPHVALPPRGLAPMRRRSPLPRSPTPAGCSPAPPPGPRGLPRGPQWPAPRRPAPLPRPPARLP